QMNLRDARDRRRAFRLDRPAEARRYPAEREQSLWRDLVVRAVGRVVLDCDLLDLFERRAVVAHVPETRDERAPRSQTAPVDVAQVELTAFQNLREAQQVLMGLVERGRVNDDAV